MNEFIEKNRSLLRFYHLAAKIIGWVLTGVTPFLAVASILSRTDQGSANTYLLLLSIRNFVVYYICLGLIFLVVARFIKYLYSEEPRPGWILRHFEKFLYIYAFLMAAGLYAEFLAPRFLYEGISSDELTYLLTRIILTLAHVLIIIGLGHIIRRILPVIEESKTLV